MRSPTPAYSPDATEVLLLEGTRRLVLGPVVGRGALGIVRVGELQSASGVRKRVAVKVFDALFASEGEGTNVLARAVRHAAHVRHPNLVEVFELGVLGEHPYIVTELVEGCSLDTLRGLYATAARRMPLDLVLFVATEAAEGLAAARGSRNAEGIVLQMSHHDLSARQVLLSWNGEVKVGDFGFRAAGMSASGIRPARQEVRKTLTYLAPEVVRGDRGDARSDVFAMGIILHELLRGPRYADEASDTQVYEATLRGDILRTVREPLLPTELAAVIERATSLDPQERPAHAGVLAYDLRRIALSMGVGDARTFLRHALFEMTEGMLPAEKTEPNPATL